MPKTKIINPPTKAIDAARVAYHHGNLKEEALSLAVTQVEANGADVLSIRGLATALGTAHRALYNHFADKRALLAAIAEIGFRDLVRQTENAHTAGAFASAYLEFALSRAFLYDLMMSQSHSTIASHSGLNEAVQSLIGIATKSLGSNTLDATQSRRAVMRLWMLVHGGVNLHASGMLKLRSNDEFISEVLAIANLE